MLNLSFEDNIQIQNIYIAIRNKTLDIENFNWIKFSHILVSCDEELYYFNPEKFNWREEILKQQIPENVLEFLGYLEDEDCCNLYIKEIKEI